MIGHEVACVKAAIFYALTCLQRKIQTTLKSTI